MSMRENFILNDKSQMLAMISMATDEMIRLVAMYPDVWFMDTMAGQCWMFYFLVEFNEQLNSMSV